MEYCAGINNYLTLKDMNNILTKELNKKHLTWKSITYIGSAAGAVGGQANFDMTLKTSQPIYIKDILADYTISIVHATDGLSIVNNNFIYNPAGLYVYEPPIALLHSSNPVPKPNDVQIVAGATEFSASANESKQCLAFGINTDIERIIVGNFGVFMQARIYDTKGGTGNVFIFSGRITINYAVIDGIM